MSCINIPFRGNPGDTGVAFLQQGGEERQAKETVVKEEGQKMGTPQEQMPE